MDELSRTTRFSRRLALSAIVCCSATCGYADRPANASASGSATLRSLLSQGWNDTAVASPTAENVPTPSAVPVAPAPTTAPILEAVPSADAMPGPKAAPAAEIVLDPLPPSAELIRPKLQTLKVPDSVFGAGDLGDSKETSRTAQPPAPRSLAELIEQRTKKVVVPTPEGDHDAINIDLAPSSVNRLDVDRPIVDRMARFGQSESNVRVAIPIHTGPQPSEVVASPQVTEGLEEAGQESDQSETSQHAAPQLAALPQADPATSVDDEVAQPKLDEPVRPEPELSAETTPAEPEETESMLATAESTQALPTEPQLADTNASGSNPGTSLDFAGPGEATVDGENEMTCSPMSDRSRRVASSSGFDLLPFKSFEPELATRLEAESQEQALTSTIHANRLREIARESLRTAHHRLQCRATYSAKKYTLEALRSIVAMKDALSGGNQHAKYLKAAFDAVRESGDFAGRLGTVDQSALKRMVAVHETDVLKDQDLGSMTALKATESYLAVAKLNFVQAATGVPEGSDALVLLGLIERQTAARDDTHAAAVAVTLQRAAVEVEPGNAMGYRELGSTLLHQGLVEQAIWALNRSVEIHPTRSGYKRLLDASRRLGDVDTARVCLASLEDPQLASELPVQRLSPKEFAATHRPEPASFQSAAAKPKTVENPKPKADQPRVGLRSMFPFRRR